MNRGLAARAAVKGSIRRLVRSTGYDLVPASSTFSDLQASLLATCDLVVDVGANVGQYVELIRFLGYRGQVVSFEPLRDAYSVLAERAERSGNWSVRNRALGAGAGEGSLRISANGVSSSLLDIRAEHVMAAPASRVVGQQSIDISTVDAELVDVEAEAIWLKLDVQGAEGEVLDGAVESLRRVRVIQCELSLSPLYEDQTDFIDVLAHLRDRGFGLVGVLPGFQDKTTGRLLQMDGLFLRS